MSEVLGSLWSQATEAAQKAAEEQNAKLGPEVSRSLDCGFAWIVFDPARQPLSSYLKKLGTADKHWARGYYVWYSKLHSVPTQSISVHEAAAKAAAELLKAQGVKCYWSSRLD